MKRITSAALALALLVCVTTALASTAGSSSDPLVSLSYLNDTYIPNMIRTGQEAVKSAFNNMTGNTSEQVRLSYENYLLRTGDYSGYKLTKRYEAADVGYGSALSLLTGASFILTSGNARADIVSGELIDVSSGAVVSKGSMLKTGVRYFCTESTEVIFVPRFNFSCMVDGYYKTVDYDQPLQFNDVSDSEWFYAAVEYVCTKGLFNGTSETLFSPNSDMTRGMFVTVLYRLDGQPDISSEQQFTDVTDSNSYYYNAVTWASKNGISTGYDDGRFQPDKMISREEMAIIMYRYARYKGLLDSNVSDDKFHSFPDYALVSDWAVDGMIWATASSLINGSDGYIKPQNTASRAHVAQIVKNFCEFFDV